MQEITKIIYSNNFFNVIKVENNLQLDNILDEREAVIMILLDVVYNSSKLIRGA